MPPVIFDRDLLRRRRARAAALKGTTRPTYLLDRVADDLLERIAIVRRPLSVAALIGSHTHDLAGAMRAAGRFTTLIEADTTFAHARANSSTLIADPEALPFAAGALDLIVSPLVLQFANDLPGALVQMCRALRPDGLLLAALVGGESLFELRHAFAEAEAEIEGGASPRVAPFVDTRDLGGLLQRAGFALPVVDSDRVTVAYLHPLALMHDLRAMGATNVMVERRRTPLRRATLLRTCALYAERYARPDGKIIATFEILTATAWAPDASQPKPLAPGSATTRLADVLPARRGR
jgi:SAM-dependent methyltransferase